MKKLLFAIVLTTSLSGCFKNEVKCADESAQKLIHNLILDSATEGLKAEKFQDGSPMFESSKIAAYLAKFTSTLTAVRTEKNDPDSNKNFCAAEVSFTIPTTMLTEAESMRKELNLNTIGQLADQLKIKIDANIVKTSITYSVQPTDAGDEVFVLLDNPDSMGKILHEVTSSVLIKPIIEKQRADAIAQQQKLQAEQAKARSGEQCLDEKITAYRAEVGDDAMIRHDQIAEWEVECNNGI